MKKVHRHFLLSLLVLAICTCAALVGGNVIANSAQQSGGSSVTGSSTESSPATKLGAGAHNPAGCLVQQPETRRRKRQPGLFSLQVERQNRQRIFGVRRDI